MKKESSSLLKKGGARPARTKKLLCPEARTVVDTRRQESKVFCFFSSEKKTFLPLSETAQVCLVEREIFYHEGTKARRYHKDFSFVKPSCLCAFVVNSILVWDRLYLGSYLFD
jgi:hypothetical protein